MDTKKVTVLIIGNDNEDVKSFELNRSLITNYKKYLIYAGSALLAVFLICFAIFAYSVKISIDKSSLNSQLTSVNEKLNKYDSLQLSQKLNKIDNNLSMIDGYLKERGLLKNENIGGVPSSKKQLTQFDKINFYENQSEIFYHTLRDLPIGYPYNGTKSSDYGYRRNPFGGFSSEFHGGVDFKGPVGDPIYATGDGVVNRCDWYNGYGNAVVIDHESGYQSLFGHLSSVNVVQGQQIKAGDVISTGRSTGPHLHYEIRKDGNDISPEPFLRVY
ncbi:MAG TPA: M23 family metallopeptidase [Ignavibacteria bacterium]|nr:M23 family metallopeptidase [Ignavibacteria bacterium]